MKPYLLPRLILVALYTTVVAGTWDAWWHGAIGRESFWSPSHLLLYASVLVAVGLGVYGWRTFKEAKWKRLAWVLLLVPASAPFDELWHRLFGIETVASPEIVWSPPHLVLIGAVIWGFIEALRHIWQEQDHDAVRLFGALGFAGISSLLAFVATPLQPIGPYHLLGFWGAGFVCLTFLLPLLLAQKKLPGIGVATLTTSFIIVLAAMGLGEKLAPGVIVPAHAHPPGWVIVFSFLLPALFLDIFRKGSDVVRGAIAGVLCCGTLYVLARPFLEAPFQYSWNMVGVAVLASIVGGTVSGFIAGELPRIAFSNKN